MRKSESQLRKLERQIVVAARPAYKNRINPYNNLLYAAIVEDAEISVEEHKYASVPWRADILHVHWPEVIPRSLTPKALLKAIAEWATIISSRLTGVKIVWTAHNSFPHTSSSSRFNRFLWKRFLSILDGVIFLSKDSREDLLTEYPELNAIESAVIRHGHYQPWIELVRASGGTISDEIIIALKSLENCFTILNFGQMLPYKNIEGLMTEFSKLLDPMLRLLIIGGSRDPDYVKVLQEMADTDNRIVFVPQHVDDCSFVACLDRADLIVLPYRKILNSGSALMALSFGKHAVAPALGSLRSLRNEVGEKHLTLYERSLAVQDLRDGIERATLFRSELPDLSQYEWPLIASQTAAMYRRLCPTK